MGYATYEHSTENIEERALTLEMQHVDTWTLKLRQINTNVAQTQKKTIFCCSKLEALLSKKLLWCENDARTLDLLKFQQHITFETQTRSEAARWRVFCIFFWNRLWFRVGRCFLIKIATLQLKSPIHIIQAEPRQP